MLALIYVVNIESPVQVDINGLDFVLIPLQQGVPWNEVIDELAKVLKAKPELKFELIESSCCGGGGSFGIESEHADMGMQMAELLLQTSGCINDNKSIGQAI